MAVSEYYVDPQSGNDTTGDGTSGTPWKTVQKALDTITRNATDGDRINVKAGAADTLTATLSYTTYGTPTDVARLVIQGYTSTAGDGGIGEINGGGTYSICTAWTYVTFADMKLGNCGSADVLDLGTRSAVFNCEVHTTSGFGIDSGSECVIIGCYLHDLTGTKFIDGATGMQVIHNYMTGAVTTDGIGSGSYATVIGNIVAITGADTSVHGISVSSYTCVMLNSVYVGNSNANAGINVTGANCVIMNNIVEGWSGVGGDGILADTYHSIVGSNAVYNCTNAVTLAAAKLNYAITPNDTLGASAFVNAGTGDFDINGTVTGVTEDAYPVGGFKGNASVSNKADKGAVQAGAGTATGGSEGVSRSRILGGV